MRAKLAKNDGDGVVLLHGLRGNCGQMRRLERHLWAHDYRTANLSYPSHKASIDELIENIRPQIEQFVERLGESRVHFIGHSMGNLLILRLLLQHRPANLGRMVAIAPPFGGTEVADFVQNWPGIQAVFGPALRDLRTDRSAQKQQAGVAFPLGIIAGDRSIDPIASLLIIPGASDGRVSVERTKLAGMSDHITIHASHLFLLFRRQTALETLHFLQYGHFFRAR